MVTFTKGYGNTAPATTSGTIGSTFDVRFAANYSKINSGKAASKKDVTVYENMTNPTTKAREFLGIQAKAIPSLSMELPIGDISSSRVSAPGVTSRLIKLTTEGWNYVHDDANSDFKNYQPGYSIVTKISWNEDDFVDESMMLELLNHHLSQFVKEDGATSRLRELMRGSFAEAN